MIKKFFMAVIAIMMTASVSAQFYIYLSNGDVLQADSISTVAPTPSSDNGMLSGEFSVSATEKDAEHLRSQYASCGPRPYQRTCAICASGICRRMPTRAGSLRRS